MLNDPLANTMSKMLNAENIGLKEITTSPNSKIVRQVLTVMKESHYVGDYEEVENGRGGILKINLIGNINKCGAIKPRFAVAVDEIEKFEKSFLPAKDFGILVMSTSQGVMSHTEAKKKNVGGKLLAYCY